MARLTQSLKNPLYRSRLIRLSSIILNIIRSLIIDDNLIRVSIVFEEFHEVVGDQNGAVGLLHLSFLKHSLLRLSANKLLTGGNSCFLSPIRKGVGRVLLLHV